METLVAVAHHKNHQYHDNKRSHGSTRFCSSSPPSGTFWGINCRTLHSGEGLHSAPFKSCSTKTPVTKKAFCSSSSPKTPVTKKRFCSSSSPKTPVTKKTFCSSSSPKTPSLAPNENPKISGRIAKTSSVPIPVNIKFDHSECGFYFSELWAGPAYSNSPPPSSLPMPKFSLRPKRSVSLDLPALASEIDLPPFSKSAPASPRERSPIPNDVFDIADSATKTLRRMLNLDIGDE